MDKYAENIRYVQKRLKSVDSLLAVLDVKLHNFVQGIIITKTLMNLQHLDGISCQKMGQNE